MAFVAYYRCSTAEQQASGLGLAAQKEAVDRYLNQVSGTLLKEFTEAESGKKNDRPQLQAALAMCRRHRAILIVAKLDRVGRKAGYVLSLKDTSGVDVRYAEMPYASDLEIGVRAVVAEEEGRAISERTKAALAAAKARGQKLGFADPRRNDAKACGDKGRAKAVAKSAEVRQAKAVQRAGDIRPLIEEIQAQGVTSLRGIAEALNERGERTARGKIWMAESVRRILDKEQTS